jgi:hypothetical protein
MEPAPPLRRHDALLLEVLEVVAEEIRSLPLPSDKP